MESLDETIMTKSRMIVTGLTGETGDSWLSNSPKLAIPSAPWQAEKMAVAKAAFEEERKQIARRRRLILAARPH